MKSVGEAMGIGRSFQEALQKACQSLEIKRNGLGADGREIRDAEDILDSLERPRWNRLFHIYDAFKLGIPFNTIQKLTKIDPWFLRQVEELIQLEKQIEQYRIEDLPRELFMEAKKKGYADRQIAHLVRCLESAVFRRRQELGIHRVWKLVDTCAAEFEARTPYYYSTFDEENEKRRQRQEENRDPRLGSEPDRAGDRVRLLLRARRAGREGVRVRDDHDQLQPGDRVDRFRHRRQALLRAGLWEHIYEILLHEKPEGVIVQLGGQTALKLAEKLNKYGFRIIGTSYESLDLAEDRGRFSTLCAT